MAIDYNFDVKKVTEECVQWIRDWFKRNGNGCNAVIGISGGKDSSVVAALCCEALGKDKVIGVMMPNGEQSDIACSYDLVMHLGIKYTVVNIGALVEACQAGFYLHEANSYTRELNPIVWSEQTKINLPPRIRMSMLYAISQSLNGRVSCNCNLSEDWVGYSTRYGDSVGDFAPLAQLTTDEVTAIGDYLNLPYELTHKVPSDGLCGKTDEDNFGFTYEVLNKYIRTGVCDNEETKKKIDRMYEKNRFKLEPMPCYIPNPNDIFNALVI